VNGKLEEIGVSAGRWHSSKEMKSLRKCRRPEPSTALYISDYVQRRSHMLRPSVCSASALEEVSVIKVALDS
jgi:hypothetical protein